MGLLIISKCLARFKTDAYSKIVYGGDDITVRGIPSHHGYLKPLSLLWFRAAAI